MTQGRRQWLSGICKAVEVVQLDERLTVEEVSAVNSLLLPCWVIAYLRSSLICAGPLDR